MLPGRTVHVFGCLCFYFVPERDRSSKLSPRSLPAIYLGCDPERNGHVVYVPGLQRLTTGYHIIFNEYKWFADNTFRSKVSFDESPVQQDFKPIGRSKRHYYEDRDDTPGTERQNDQATNDDQQLDPLSSDYSPAEDPAHGTTTEWNDKPL